MVPCPALLVRVDEGARARDQPPFGLSQYHPRHTAPSRRQSSPSRLLPPPRGSLYRLASSPRGLAEGMIVVVEHAVIAASVAASPSNDANLRHLPRVIPVDLLGCREVWSGRGR
jgi:hypothetical protein